MKIYFTSLRQSFILLLVLVSFFGAMVGNVYAGSASFLLYCTHASCPAADTDIIFNFNTSSNTFSPGETIDVSLMMSSADDPLPPYCPYVSLGINNANYTGDLVPDCYTLADLIGTKTIFFTTTAPVAVGAFNLNVTTDIGSKYFTPPMKNIPLTVVPLPTGTINVTSDNPSATWTITGPGPFTYTGSGSSATYPNVPTGTYTIVWGPVAGYVTPASTSFTLLSGDSLDFPEGTYTLSPTVNLNFI